MLLLYCGFVSAQFNIPAQIGKGGIPYGMQHILKSEPAIIEMPAFDLVKELKIDSSKIYGRNKSFHFGKNFKVEYSLTNYGTWEKLIDNTNVWQLTIHSKNAKAIGLVLENFNLKEGEKLFVYNGNEILGAFTFENNMPSKVFPIKPIQGESVTLEFITPNKSASRGTFYIETVAHAFENIYDFPGPCEININCPIGENWQIEKRSVCKLIIYHYAGDALLCTGSLINNTANDSKPYVITANHCLFDQSDANRTVFIFNYETTTCTDTVGPQNHALTGANVRATLYDYDFTLLEMYQHPPMPFKPYYNGWSLDTTENLNTVVSVHHPWGGVKKIAIDTLRPLINTYSDYAVNGHWRVTKWDYGVTEDGSSGGPLFDKYHRIVGTLSGGEALCGFPYNDYFERLNKSFSYSTRSEEQLKFWLDQGNSGVAHIDGLDPFPFQNYGCDTILNIDSTEKSIILPYEYGNGYYSGNNSDSIFQFAEYFKSKDSVYLTGVNFNIGRIGSTGGLTVRVCEGNSLPGKVLYETYISYKSMKSKALNYFEFYPEIKLNGNYYISYAISYLKGDTFSLNQAERLDLNPKNTAYLLNKGSWEPFNQYTAAHFGSSFDIRPIFCNVHTTSVEDLNYPVQLQVYPCPAIHILNVVLPNNQTKINSLKVMDIAGREVLVHYKLNRNIIEVDINNQIPGFYVIKVNARPGIYFSKFTKQ